MSLPHVVAGQELTSTLWNNLTDAVNAVPIATIFDVMVGRGNAGDPAVGATVVDSSVILGTTIAQTYRHLELVISGRGNAAGAQDNVLVRFNADTAANYDSFWTFAQNATAATIGSGFGATSGQVGYVPAASVSASTFGVTTVLIGDYASSGRKKTAAWTTSWADTAATNSMAADGSMTWRSTNAITQIQLYLTSLTDVWQTGSRVTLYGI